jgi:hypothetical protein
MLILTITLTQLYSSRIKVDLLNIIIQITKERRRKKKKKEEEEEKSNAI